MALYPLSFFDGGYHVIVEKQAYYVYFQKRYNQLQNIWD